MNFTNFTAQRELLHNMNYVELPISLIGFLDNLLLLHLLKHRKPFTANVRLLLSVAAASQCLITLWVLIKNLLVLLAFQYNFSVVLTKNSCFVLAGVFYAVPIQLLALLIWLILIERLYASMRFKVAIPKSISF